MTALEERAEWSTAYMNDLPDSAFLIVEKGGSKDSEGKTTPRSLRHFPVRDANGDVDMAHLRNALSRIPQSNLSSELKAQAQKKAQALMSKMGMDDNDADDRALGADWELRYAVAPITHVEVREPGETGDGSLTMSGYAAVFNEKTTLHDGALTRVTETIDPGAFNRVMAEQGIGTPAGAIHLNIGHDMDRCIAATDVPAGQVGSLQLRPDAHGLWFLARTPADLTDARDAAIRLRHGIAQQASFAMRIAKVEPSSRALGDGRFEDHQRIMEIGRVRDICIAAQGAYPQTLVQLRTMAAALGEPGSEITDPGRLTRQPDQESGVERTVSLPMAGVGAERRRMLAEMARESAKYPKR